MSDQGNIPQPEGTQPQGATPPPAGAYPPPPSGAYPPAPQDPGQAAYQPMPGMTPPVVAAGPAPTRPKSMDTAVMLMRAGGVVAVLGLLFVFIIKDDIRSAAEKALKAGGSAYTQSQVDAVVGVAVMTGIVFGLFGAALWFWMAFANGKGKSWARMVATILFAFSVLGVLSNLASSPSLLAMLPNLISFLIGAAAIFLMYKRESSDWYKAMSAPRY